MFIRLRQLDTLVVAGGSVGQGPVCETKRLATEYHPRLRPTFLHFWGLITSPRLSLHPSITLNSHHPVRKMYPLHHLHPNHKWHSWLTDFTVKQLECTFHQNNTPPGKTDPGITQVDLKAVNAEHMSVGIWQKIPDIITRVWSQHADTVVKHLYKVTSTIRGSDSTNYIKCVDI